MSVLKNLILVVVFTVISFQLIADAGPKPSMKFSLIYKTSHPVKVVEGWQLESKFNSFTIFDTLLRKGPQGFIISQDKASSVSFGYDDFHKISIRFDDKIRESNIFTDESFNSVFDLLVFDDHLEVVDVTPFMKDSSVWSAFIKALMLTLAMELLVAFVYLKLAKKPLKILLYVILGNLVTLPVVWFVLPKFMNVGGALVIGEVFSFLTEASILLLTCRHWFKPSGAFLLSFMMNLMSLLIGGLALILMVGF